MGGKRIFHSRAEFQAYQDSLNQAATDNAFESIQKVDIDTEVADLGNKNLQVQINGKHFPYFDKFIVDGKPMFKGQKSQKYVRLTKDDFSKFIGAGNEHGGHIFPLNSIYTEEIDGVEYTYAPIEAPQSRFANSIDRRDVDYNQEPGESSSWGLGGTRHFFDPVSGALDSVKTGDQTFIPREKKK